MAANGGLYDRLGRRYLTVYQGQVNLDHTARRELRRQARVTAESIERLASDYEDDTYSGD